MANREAGGGRVALALGILAVVLFCAGPLLAYSGLAPVMTGFQVFALGGLLAVITVIAAVVTAVRRGFNVARPALALGGGLMIAFLVIAMPGCGVPRINDISTDTDQPPQFIRAGTLPDNEGRDMAYPGAEFAAQQKEAYPELVPLALAVTPDVAFAAAERTAGAQPRWELTRIDPITREIEGVATTAVFRFADDFIIQVRDGGDGGSLVHMRSKSRLGKSDIGANAARIHAFFAALQEGRL